MASLFFTDADGQVSEIPLQPGVYRVGRDEENQIVAPHASVSSQHCELAVADAEVLVRDLGSTNGTCINGDLVEEGVLRAGDLLRVGDFEFRLHDDSNPVPQPLPIPVPSTRMPVLASTGAAGGSLPSTAIPGAVCQNHPSIAAAWQCQKCGELYCDTCITDGRALGVRGVKFCPSCRSLANPVGTQTGGGGTKRTFGGEMLAAWKYPFRGVGFIILITGTIFLTVATFVQNFLFLIGLLVYISVTGYWMAYAEKVVVCSAQGEDEPPTWPDFSDFIEDILVPFFHALGLFTLYLLPFLISLIALDQEKPTNMILSFGLLLAALFMMPMAWLGICMHSSIVGLSPHFVIPSILRIPGHYFAVFLELVVLVGVNIGLELALEQVTIPLIVPFISSFLSIYFLMVICRLLGMLYYINRDRLDWM